MSHSDSIVLHITWNIRPGTESSFHSALAELRKHLTAEPELQYFNAFRLDEVIGAGSKDAEEKKLPTEGVAMRMVEIWGASEDWLREVQANKEYYKEWFGAVEPLALKPRIVEVLHQADGMKFVHKESKS